MMSYLGMKMVIMIEITTKLSTARELPGDEDGDNDRDHDQALHRM